ncbi:hypothetical protein BT69DRAFT_1328110 [Atractiella rhizophila]|nr:hypothetical protein BT69DRAFT_1328110 [Atractiella rhizophila]
MSRARIWEKILLIRLDGKGGEDLKDEELEKLWDHAADTALLKTWLEGVRVSEMVEGGKVKTNISRTFHSALHNFRTYQPSGSDRSRSPAPPDVKGKGKAEEYTDEEVETYTRRKWNALETMIAMFRWLLYRKNFPNFSYDVMILFAGSLDRSDAVFSELVASIEATMTNTTNDIEIRHRTLQLALTIVASINQGSVNAYFLRRDLFSCIVQFISEPTTSIYAYETFLFLGILVNFRKYEARNPYLVRIEDLVEEDIFKKLAIVTSNACLRTTQEYFAIADDSPRTYVPKFGEVLGMLSGGFGLRSTSPVPGYRGTSSKVDIDKKGKDDIRVKEDSPFRFMPSEASIILFPFYDLLNSNKALASLMIAEVQLELDEDEEGVLNKSWTRHSPIATLISFSSYVLCHGSVSPRSRAYSRLCLIVLTLFCEEGGKVLASQDYARTIRLCRQRLPTLPYSNDRKRPPICAILDCCTLYLRHNLQKKLDVHSYIVALRLIHRIMHLLKTDRIRLVLGCALCWGEAFLVDASSLAALYFEILRSEQSLNSLSDFLGIASTAPRPTSAGATGSSSNFSSIESVRNVKAVCAHFNEKLEQARKGKGKLKGRDANEVLEIIKLNLEGLDLIDHVAMEDVRMYAESAHEGFFRDFTRIMAQDALQLVS